MARRILITGASIAGNTVAWWLGRVLDHFPKAVWLNPIPAEHWGHTHSIGMVRRIFADRMFPLTLEGLDGAMRALLR